MQLCLVTHRFSKDKSYINLAIIMTAIPQLINISNIHDIICDKF